MGRRITEFSHRAVFKLGRHARMTESSLERSGKRLRVALHSTKWILEGGGGGEDREILIGRVRGMPGFFRHLGLFFRCFFVLFFGVVFCSFFGRFGVPCWGIFGGQIGSKCVLFWVVFLCCFFVRFGVVLGCHFGTFLEAKLGQNVYM